MPTSDDEFESRSYPIQEDMRLQFKHWRMERIGWCVLGLVAVMALLGLFSDGPLSRYELRTADGALSVEFQRFERRNAPSRLVVRAETGSRGPVSLRLDGDFLDRFTVEGIQPAPESSRSHGGGLQLLLRPDATGRLEVHLYVRPEGLGLARTRLGVGGHALAFSQFIYP